MRAHELPAPGEPDRDRLALGNPSNSMFAHVDPIDRLIGIVDYIRIVIIVNPVSFSICVSSSIHVKYF